MKKACTNYMSFRASAHTGVGIPYLAEGHGTISRHALQHTPVSILLLSQKTSGIATPVRGLVRNDTLYIYIFCSTQAKNPNLGKGVGCYQPTRRAM